MNKIDDAEMILVEGESAKLPVQETIGPFSGYRPKQIRFDQQWGSVVPRSMDINSLVITQDGVQLQRDTDYLVEPDYTTIALLPGTSADKEKPVVLNYRYSLKRLDSLVRGPDGKEYIKKGVSRLANPEPPELAEGEVRIENVYIDSNQKGPEARIFLVTDEPIVTETTAGKIPRTLKKLKSGNLVKIVFWGDSVTVGGDASFEELRFANVAQRLINEKFPKAEISYDVIAVGGSGSVHWLFPEITQHATAQDQCDFSRVINAQPDLVIIEFVNDDYLSGAQFYKQYNRILAEMKKLDAEVIFVAPHLTWPGKLGISDVCDPDPRPYTKLLKQFAADNSCGLADASGRWSQTWKQGIPYPTYLKNGINHPDDRGHDMMASEIIRCFE
ncbi:MAG: hypothetical protein K9M54_13100 [Kiritimatiellales bacterium]|nr:hypothetical protein [Kiritimatiellales bacterium]MCF7863766.1 hypothetical protein [Kiritimatiellales bacterium]